MPLFTADERPAVEALVRLIHTNPFSPRWVDREREVLGAEFREAPPAYSWQAFWVKGHLHPNVLAVGERISALVTAARARLGDGGAGDPELADYEDLALYHLYRTHGDRLDEVAERARAGAPLPEAGGIWTDFSADFKRYLSDGRRSSWHYNPGRVFAVFFQMRRAFVQIYDHIVGSSQPAAELRAAVWQSIFTHDLRRYYRTLCERMRLFPTLITGESGTGKELVARALGHSQYVPFDAKKGCFGADFGRVFFALNPSALSPTLIESELFGHRKGAFTGAVEDRTGWLELCDPHGAVFLDEIGEVDAALQVKLLRVLQERSFERLGESEPRRFHGKLVAATNRNLAVEMQAGRFRRDFYYRLCADQVTTPTLRAQLAANPADLENLVLFVTRAVLGGPTAQAPDGEAQELAAEVVGWIDAHLGRDYSWPGNFRELGHCARGVMIRGDYPRLPPEPAAEGSPAEELARRVATGALTAAELERRYFTLVYLQAGSYQKAAERLGVDWRTVRDKVGR